MYAPVWCNSGASNRQRETRTNSKVLYQRLPTNCCIRSLNTHCLNATTFQRIRARPSECPPTVVSALLDAVFLPPRSGITGLVAVEIQSLNQLLHFCFRLVRVVFDFTLCIRAAHHPPDVQRKMITCVLTPPPVLPQRSPPRPFRLSEIATPVSRSRHFVLLPETPAINSPNAVTVTTRVLLPSNAPYRWGLLTASGPPLAGKNGSLFRCASLHRFLEKVEGVPSFFEALTPLLLSSI